MYIELLIDVTDVNKSRLLALVSSPEKVVH